MRSLVCAARIAGPLVLLIAGAAGAAEPLGFTVKLDTVLEHDDGRFLWFHPRVAAIPKAGRGGKPAVVLTLQELVVLSGKNLSPQFTSASVSMTT